MLRAPYRGHVPTKGVTRAGWGEPVAHGTRTLGLLTGAGLTPQRVAAEGGGERDPDVELIALVHVLLGCQIHEEGSRPVMI